MSLLIPIITNHMVKAICLCVFMCSNSVYRIRTTKCITEIKIKVLRFIFAFFFYFLTFSISHSNIMNIEIFVKEFSGTT